MKKLFKILVVIVLLGAIAWFIIPEKDFRKAKKEGTKMLAVELDLPPVLTNFIVNTKTGRKIAWVFIKEEVKNEIDDILKDEEKPEDKE